MTPAERDAALISFFDSASEWADKESTARDLVKRVNRCTGQESETWELRHNEPVAFLRAAVNQALPLICNDVTLAAEIERVINSEIDPDRAYTTRDVACMLRLMAQDVTP